jgi:hypothetical protein
MEAVVAGLAGREGFCERGRKVIRYKIVPVPNE